MNNDVTDNNNENINTTTTNTTTTNTTTTITTSKPAPVRRRFGITPIQNINAGKDLDGTGDSITSLISNLKDSAEPIITNKPLPYIPNTTYSSSSSISIPKSNNNYNRNSFNNNNNIDSFNGYSDSLDNSDDTYTTIKSSSFSTHFFKKSTTSPTNTSPILSTSLPTTLKPSFPIKPSALKPSFPIKPSAPILKPTLPQKPNNNTSITTSFSQSSTINTTINNNYNKVIFTKENQRGNPIIRNFSNQITIEYKPNQIPDYIINSQICIFYLSIKQFRLNANTLQNQIKNTPTSFETRILLVLVDVDDCINLLEELNINAIKLQLTLIVCWSTIEAAKYIESYKQFSVSNKSVDFIKARPQSVEQGGKTKKEQVLTSIKSINKTDSQTLINNFKNMKAIFTCQRETLLKCPGFGPVKAQNFYNTIHQPFKSNKKNTTSTSTTTTNTTTSPIPHLDYNNTFLNLTKDKSNTQQTNNNNINKNNNNNNNDYSDTRLNLEILKENKNKENFIDDLSFDFGSDGEDNYNQQEDEEDENYFNSEKSK